MRLPLARIAAVLVAASLVTYTFFIAPRLGGVDGSTPAAAANRGGGGPGGAAGPPEFPPANEAFLGLTTAEGVHNFGPVDAFAEATKSKPSVFMFSEGWATDHFSADAFNKVANRGMMPLLSWEPWDYRATVQADNSRNVQPKYSLAHIINGDFDSYIRSYADGIRGLGYEVGIRFAHEMNGFWYPWSEQSNGNHPGEYVKMWQHVHDIFTQAGVNNVVWVWSANVSYSSSLHLNTLYPGDNYVDWLGLSGYYGTEGTESYRGFDATFAPTMAELRTFSHKPLALTEIGATDSAHKKATWITELFANLRKHPDIIGVIWFEAVRDVDWRLSNAPAAAGAWGVGAADKRYSAVWTPDAVIRRQTAFPTPSASPSDRPTTKSTPPNTRVTPTPTKKAPSKAPPTIGAPTPTPTQNPTGDPTPTPTA